MISRFIVVVIAVLVGCSSANAQDEYAGSDAGVGEVRHSLLSETDFQDQYGPDWRLLRRIEMTGAPIAQFLAPELKEDDGKIYLPDGAGMFLRMPNHADGSGADEIPRHLGSVQEESFKKHEHDYTDIFWSESNGGVPLPRPHRGNTGPEDYDNRGHEMGRRSKSTGTQETRPDNIAINFFVRIACSTGNKCGRGFQ